MSTDLFNNNTSNDYVNPDLPQCPGESDSAIFEFLPNQQVGVISGSDIIMSMSLGDILQPVTGWVQQTKILQPGEVIFVQGLTRGISSKVQIFPFDASVIYTGSNHQYYLSVDMSINYYKNFRYYQDSIYVTADYTNQINIENALNIEFDNRGITVSASYDPSALSFTSNVLGYNYNITSLDVSLFQFDTSTNSILAEDTSSNIPAFKYPNGAMLGYVLKITYPNSVTDQSSMYIDINHAPDYLVYFEPSTGNTDAYLRYYKAVDVGLNGASTDDTMSAADYLDYVQSNNKWEKVGVLKIWLAAQDPENSNVENLITGFYLFNPQTFAVQIEYMIIL